MSEPPAVLAIWRNLHLADAIICQELNTRLSARAGCSLVDHDLLAWVYAAPGQRLRMLDLSRLLRVTPGGLTRIVDRGVARGWIRRDRPDRNRREVFAVLTDGGRDLLRRAGPVYDSVLDDMIARQLSAPDLTALRDVSRKLLDRVRADGAGSCPD